MNAYAPCPPRTPDATLLSLLVLALACGGREQNGRTASDGGGITTLTGGDTDTSASGTTTGSGNDSGIRLDVGGGSGTGSNPGDDMTNGCKKVDLLFVIDDSGSMADEQANLAASVPGFINQIQTQLADTEGYHIGVVTSDAYIFNDPACIAEGALVTQTGGPDSSNAVCTPFATGMRFMDETDDLNAKFTCAARVGTGGDGNERPMQTLTKALSDALAAPGACNEGFLRDDALLVVVIITDEEDDHEVDGCLQQPQPGSAGDPPDWFDAVVAAKDGIESNIVVLALVGPKPPNACPALDKCAGGIQGAEQATRIIEFTEMFTYGFVGQVCAPTYEPFFEEAVSIIESACDDFVPPG